MAKFEFPKRTTGQMVRIFVLDSSQTDGRGLSGLVFNSALLTARYLREGDSSPTTITLVTATIGTYTSGGFIEVDATNMKGIYEIGIPDAAMAEGAKQVLIHLRGAANMVPVPLEIHLTEERAGKPLFGFLCFGLHQTSPLTTSSSGASSGFTSWPHSPQTTTPSSVSVNHASEHSVRIPYPLHILGFLRPRKSIVAGGQLFISLRLLKGYESCSSERQQ